MAHDNMATTGGRRGGVNDRRLVSQRATTRDMNDGRLTPQAVHDKQFSTTRLRPGYDQEETDAFLDLVESEISLLIRERENARAAVEELRRILPKDQPLEELVEKVATLYRILWEQPHPDTRQTP
jgi:DivIVA domain-containing protein